MAHKQNKSEFIDIQALFRNYLRHWWWFAISVGICGICAYVYVKTHPKEYVVRANVLVSEDDTGSFTAMSGMSDLFGSSANVEDEVFIINSHSVLRDVSRKLGINKIHMVKTGFLSSKLAYPKFPVDVYAAPAITDTLMSSIEFKVDVAKNGTADIEAKVGRNTIAEMDDAKLPAMLETSYGRFVVNTTDSYKKGEEVESTIWLNGHDATAEDLAVSVKSDKASRKSNMIELYIQSPNSLYGVDVLNNIVANYNERAINDKNQQGEKTKAFIDERLALISGDLSEAESNIQRYKQDRGIVDVGAEASYNMNVRGAAESALVQARTNSELVKMARDFLRQPENAYELIPGANDMGAASGAVSTYNSLIMRRMELSANARGNNKVLKALDKQIAAMRATINSTLDRAYETSLVAVRDAQAEANKARGKLGNVPAQEREFLGLQRQQAVKQQLYLFLLQRREETSMLLANAIPKGRIVDEAYTLKEPVGMGKFQVLAIAILIGLFIPIFLLYMQRFLRTKFEDVDELKKLTDVPVLGEVCVDKSGECPAVRPNDTSSTSELFRALRTRLGFMLKPEDKVIVVTSTRSGEGKSYVSLNFAVTMALLGKKVLLIGGDIRNPSLADYLGLPNRAGLTTFLANPQTPLNTLITPFNGVPNLSVMVAGPIPPNPAELLASHAVEDLFERLRQEYDFIIVDSAPVGMVSDTFNLDRIADATMYVCRANYTTRTDVRFFNDVYDDKRLTNMSLVINGTHSVGRYGYGYGGTHTHTSTK